MNLRKEKWLVTSIYRLPLDSLSRFLESLTDIIDFFSSSYDNFITMGDFNVQSFDSTMKDFIKVNGLVNLNKGNTCFKGQGFCIDLILTNRRFLFKHSNSYQTGISDRHHLIYSMLKSNFSNSEPKMVTYRYFFENLKTSLDTALRHCSIDYKDSEHTFPHAPKKKRVVRGNHKPHLNGELRKAILLRSRLKNNLW